MSSIKQFNLHPRFGIFVFEAIRCATNYIFEQTGVFVLGNIFSKPTVFATSEQNVEVSPDAKITFCATLVHLLMFIC